MVLSLTPIAARAAGAPQNLTAVWANDGGDKVTQDETRGSTNPLGVVNSVWTGSKVKIFGGKNEVVAFNLVLEAANRTAGQVSVSLNALTGPNGARIGSVARTGEGVFNWTERNIELFFVRYLQIKGLSHLSYESYDERHVPRRMQRPWTEEGMGSGTWMDRPDHDKYYPEIAVPLELEPSFKIARGQNQSIWTDIYIPKSIPSGLYEGVITVKEGSNVSYQVPVELTVRGFTLPDTPNSKSMVHLGYSDLGIRYFGESYPEPGTPHENSMRLLRDRHFQLAHRHKISIIDQDPSASTGAQDSPHEEWLSRLDGTLFTPEKGYDGPGVASSNGVYSIGQYSTWDWKDQGRQGMWTHTDNWEQWFQTHFPSVERFLYLLDETENYPLLEQYANWMSTNPGVGKNLKSFATIPADRAMARVPSLKIAATWMAVGERAAFESAASYYENAAQGREFYSYCGKRPASGSFATEDDGVALRELAWGQYKKGISRWYFWESTYYTDYQSGRGPNDLFHDAQTFGQKREVDSVLGETGWNHSNGDGVLFYPGTDTVFPKDSYGVLGPLASLRLKHWRRGIQDVDYIALAKKINPTAVQAIIDRLLPRVMWENGVADSKDPTWVRTDIGWSTRADDWESARLELARIIEQGK